MKTVIHPPQTATSRPPGHGQMLLGRPKSPIPVVSNRDQVQSRAGDRGLKITWTTATQIFSDSAKTNNYALHKTPVSPPGDAVAAILVVELVPTSSAGGSGHISFYSDLAGTNEVAEESWVNLSDRTANTSCRSTLFVPIVAGSVIWDTTTTGTVAYSTIIILVGFLRG